MICRIRGRLVRVNDDVAEIETPLGLAYEVLIARSAAGILESQLDTEITLHTLEYYEGNPAGANLVPRLVGFLTPAERRFFSAFTTVRGISSRRALRAMAMPIAELAAAIERGDVHVLTSLPEIGKKTAAQIVSELRGRLGEFADESISAAPAAALTAAQRVAVDILVQWGDRRADAERWVVEVLRQTPLEEPDAIVRAVYRLKQTGGR